MKGSKNENKIFDKAQVVHTSEIYLYFEINRKLLHETSLLLVKYAEEQKHLVTMTKSKDRMMANQNNFSS